jgi:hypothetical protein
MSKGLWVKTYQGRARLHSWRTLLPLALSILALVVGLFLAAPQELYQPPLSERTRADLLNLLQSKEPPGSTQVDELWLVLKEGQLDNQLQEAKRAKRSGEYIKGFFRWGEDRFHEVGVRLRGSMPWHHTYAKPSLRVKFRKKQNPYGFRYLELHRSEDPWGFINRGPEWIAQQETLMSAYSFPARLFLNRKDMGLYMAALRPGSALALKNSRMPGTWFKGDAVGGGLILWEGLGAWRIFGATEAPEAEGLFEEFLGLVKAAPSFTPQQRLRFSEIVDEDKYALWDALGVLTGSIHTDDGHNQSFFFSSYEGQIEPVLWDANSFGPLQLADGSPNVLNNRVRHLAFTDPRYVHRRNLHLHRILDEYFIKGRLKEWMKEEVVRLRPVTESETALGIIAHRYPLDGPRAAEGDLFHRPLSVADLEPTAKALYQWIDERQAYLQNYLSQAAFTVERSEKGCRVTVYGEVAVKATLPNGNQILLFPGLAYGVEMEVGRRVTRPAPLDYNLPFPAEGLTFQNAVTGASVSPGTGPATGSRKNVFSFHPWQLKPQLPPRNLQLGPGEVALSEDLVVEAGSSLTIEPGTTLRLGPGVSVFSAGVVRALGTRENPIHIRRSGSQPFGCVGLVGAGTAGSEFRYLDCEGGSVGSWRGVTFKGMFDVYGCPDLNLSNCRFAKNEVGDDTVNLAAGRATIRDCRFEDGKADGLDMDQMTGQILDCEFLRAGNDGLDLMTCQVQIASSRFQKCGDKGISVGEGSRVEVTQCEFLQNEKGLEGKDKCQARVADSLFEGNRLALNLYRKKWLYPSGGRVFLSNCELIDNRRDVAVDAESVLWLDRTEVRPPLGLGSVHHRAPVGWDSSL